MSGCCINSVCECRQRYIIAIGNSKKRIIVTITNSSSSYNCFYFPSNNSNRNCVTA